MAFLKLHLYNILGWLSFSLGVIGAFLPILPTTPFILLAAHFFSKGSPRYYRWLTELKYFGPKVKNWKEHGVIDKRSKVIASVSIVLILGGILCFGSHPIWLKCTLSFILVTVVGFINTRPNEPKQSGRTGLSAAGSKKIQSGQLP